MRARPSSMFFIRRWRFFSFNCAPCPVTATASVTVAAARLGAHASRRGKHVTHLLRVQLCIRNGQQRVFLRRLIHSGLGVVLAVTTGFLMGHGSASQFLADLRERLVSGFCLQTRIIPSKAVISAGGLVTWFSPVAWAQIASFPGAAQPPRFAES